MSLPSQEPIQPITTAQVEEWIDAATLRRLQLHFKATEPLYSPERAEAFLEMGELLEEAIEEVRVVNAALREQSEQLRARIPELLERSARLQGERG